MNFIREYRKFCNSVGTFFYEQKLAIVFFALILICLWLLYTLVNSFYYPKVIIENARSEQFSQKYASAISIYDNANKYYNMNHFSEDNKKIYFGIPYQKAACFLGDKNMQASIRSMSDGVTSIQVQYGTFSPEFAYFIRKYLIPYYLEFGNVKLATKEFDNLLLIYKNISYSDAELADVARLSGDLYYENKQYDIAMQFYKKAYNALIQSKKADYEAFSQIVDRIVQYDIQDGRIELAFEVYRTSIDVLRNSGADQRELTAIMLVKYGDLCLGQNQLPPAIKSYEEAVELIKALPRLNYMHKNLNFYLSILQKLYTDNGQFSKASEMEYEIAHPKKSILPF